MKHIKHAELEGVDCLVCQCCGDQMTLQFGDWPFWMKLALQQGFADIHSTCEQDDHRSRAVHESLTCTRKA